MKTIHRLFWCGLLLAAIPALAPAQTSFLDRIFPPLPKPDDNIISGIFVVHDVSGTAECLADGRIWNLAKGEKVLARGAVIRTKDNSHVTLLFSNQTSLYLEPKTSLKVEKFDQEPFQPNNDLLHEPSSSQTLIYIQRGNVVIATPQLYSGTHLLFETQHCVCAILNGQSGGEKAFIEVTDVQTHIGMIQGLARINTRQANGDFDFTPHYVPDEMKNRQAFVKYAQNGSSSATTQSVNLAAGGDVPATAAEAQAAQNAPAALGRGIDVPQDSFYVAKAGGEVDCAVKGRSLVLKQGDWMIARGAIVTTQPNSSATLLFSNHTSMALGEKAEIKVDKYDQEAFKPNNSLEIEPSNSQSVILVHYGRLEVSTPQLLAGTSMVFESAHGAVNLLRTDRGGDQAFLEVTPKQTSVQMGNGLASLAPRNPDGSLQTVSTPIGPGPIAVIKPALGANPSIDSAFARSGAPAAVAPGNFTVRAVAGEVDFVAGGQASTLKSGDSFPAAGASLRTAAGASATLLLSSQSSLQIGEKAGLRIEQFEQEGSATANPLAEPGISRLRAVVASGSVVLETPELNPASRAVLETPHASVALAAGLAGGQQVGVDVAAKATRVSVAAGKAAVSPRGLDGQFVAARAGTELLPGQEATVQPTLDSRSAIAAITTVPADAPPAAPAGAAISTEPAPAVVLQVVGLAKARASAGSPDAVLAAGDQVPVGGEIETAAGAQVYLQAFPGAVANIQPGSDVVVEKIETETAGQTVLSRTAILDLKKGTVVSLIDPAKRNINHYAVRTPKGLAQARGTSFAVTVGDSDMSVAATADTVTFTTPSGATYAIAAGNVTITPPGGEPQAPIALSQAVAANPAFATVVQTALTTVANAVQNNLGNLPANSAANLLAQVVGVASAAVPAQAAAFTTQAITAATAPAAATAGNATAAVGAVTAAAVTAAPAQGSQVAVAAAQAAPSQTVAAVAAAAQAAPAQAAAIASAVVQSTAAANPQATALSSAQSAAVIAAAATAGAPAQAAAVAASVMQTTLSANPNQSAAAVAQAATMLASAVSNTAPSQSAAVATALLGAVNSGTNGNSGANSQLASALNTAAAVGASTSSTGTASSGAGSNQPTSVTVNQSGGGNGQGGNSQGGNSQGGNGQGSNVASNGGGNSQGGNGQGGGSQATSVTVSAVTGGPGSTGTTTTTTTTTTTVSNAATSVTTSQLTGGQEAQIAGALQSATNAQSSATFSAGASNQNGTPNTPTVTQNTPANLAAAAADAE